MGELEKWWFAHCVEVPPILAAVFRYLHWPKSVTTSARTLTAAILLLPMKLLFVRLQRQKSQIRFSRIQWNQDRWRSLFDAAANLSPSLKNSASNIMILKGINFRQQKTHQPWTEMAGLMGSTKWGHQRKAVALIKTDALRKSSAVVQKNFIFRATSVLS